MLLILRHTRSQDKWIITQPLHEKPSCFLRLDRLDSTSYLILVSNWTGYEFYFVADSCGGNLDGSLTSGISYPLLAGPLGLVVLV